MGLFEPRMQLVRGVVVCLSARRPLDHCRHHYHDTFHGVGGQGQG
jgi:hypothetical protein